MYIKTQTERIPLSQYQQEVLYGSLLGDGHLEIYCGRQSNSYRYILVQSTRKSTYIRWMQSVFASYVTQPLYIRCCPTKQGYTTTYRLCTQRHSDFSHFGQAFYPHGIKCVPRIAHTWLTPRALAVWYMEDGSIKSKVSKGVYLNTHGFSLDDIEYLCDVLYTRYTIQCWPVKDRHHYRIYVSGHSYTCISRYIVPYLTSDMLYKWPPPRVTNLPKE